MSSIQEKLRQSIFNPDTNTNDKLWYRYVLDYAPDLRALSEVRAITADEARVFQHDVNRYLRSINYPPKYKWIVCVVNDFANDQAFDDVRLIYIPRPEEIQLLYSRYLSVKLPKAIKV